MDKRPKPPKPPTARDVLALFGSMPEAAKVLGLRYKAVSKMAERDSIAVEHWPAVIAAAHALATACAVSSVQPPLLVKS